MESEVSAESAQEGTSSEYVELPDATDEDIDAFLANADQFEPGAEVVQQAENPKQETEQKVEPPKLEDKKPTVVTQEAFDAMKKQLDGLELYTKRRTSELGELKRQFREFVSQAQASLDEQFLESPTQGYRTARQIEMAQQKLQEIEQEEQSLTNSHQAQVLLSHHVGPDGLDIEAVTQSLVADGMPQEFIQQFAKNPYQAALPETLIQLAKRATAEKKVRDYEAALSEIVPFVQQLIEERKKVPQDVLRNVQSALRQSPQVTASAGGTGQVGSRSVDPAMMSDAELEALLGK
jgi:hypothetical protein